MQSRTYLLEYLLGNGFLFIRHLLLNGVNPRYKLRQFHLRKVDYCFPGNIIVKSLLVEPCAMTLRAHHLAIKLPCPLLCAAVGVIVLLHLHIFHYTLIATRITAGYSLCRKQIFIGPIEDCVEHFFRKLLDGCLYRKSVFLANSRNLIEDKGVCIAAQRHFGQAPCIELKEKLWGAGSR